MGQQLRATQRKLNKLFHKLILFNFDIIFIITTYSWVIYYFTDYLFTFDILFIINVLFMSDMLFHKLFFYFWSSIYKQYIIHEWYVISKTIFIWF